MQGGEGGRAGREGERHTRGAARREMLVYVWRMGGQRGGRRAKAYIDAR